MEFWQNYILFLFQKTGVNLSFWKFIGRTSLPFSSRVRGYSDDLNFSATEKLNPSKLSINSLSCLED
ncbi:MAG: hypothetical protein B5M54_04060 [Candidatus Aminicenantes bacterium 4484_214]|nr:MAG: hypothetical protein B5M54_04060 [Candidatus Aminicenantes bacterium 4484_214]RLE10170.1 MAG: hypothetical protein DRJ06_01530 [Candidatus Aminicenantes bacterium]